MQILDLPLVLTVCFLSNLNLDVESQESLSSARIAIVGTQLCLLFCPDGASA